MLQKDIRKELLGLSRIYLKKINSLARVQLLRHFKAQQWKGTPTQFRQEWKQTSAYLKEGRLRLQVKGLDKRISVLKLVLKPSHLISYAGETKSKASFE